MALDDRLLLLTLLLMPLLLAVEDVVARGDTDTLMDPIEDAVEDPLAEGLEDPDETLTPGIGELEERELGTSDVEE